MCDFTKVYYGCGHYRLLVRAWCTQYVQSQGTNRCGVTVVAENHSGGNTCGSECIHRR
ncbi:hypothetical protein FPQ18DRAFT_313511 [Pyronema domesticum]|uniref:Uncharacterized protein n=1 Tax=Pyronema omphalodes (strain CBS 100304) TaxID=1076935 RepID=U4LE02_PYROM|nr:hypothetical protein FPQ18DRAFT_313511 [Pyronema domesticum]CCX30314.1 Similar to hypothetical protein MGYG_09138 [Arthroderma gypseum CBS 118893]; acc. no. XP_003170789 [Pyronema omphalodes CBS 100304]